MSEQDNRQGDPNDIADLDAPNTEEIKGGTDLAGTLPDETSENRHIRHRGFAVVDRSN